MYLLTPITCDASATPENSATVLNKSTKRAATITKKVERKPNSSRIRSERPLPVMTPMRPHISSLTYSAMVMGISDHSSVYPKCAPAWVYVLIPPASLSTLDVISPGPTTARNTARRRRNVRLRRVKSLLRVFSVESLSVTVSRLVIALDSLNLKSLQLGPHMAHHVIHGDGSNRAIAFIYHRQAAQIVFVEQLENFLLLRVGRHRELRRGSQFRHPLVAAREQQSRDGHVARECGIAVDQHDVVELIGRNLVEPNVVHHFAARRVFAHHDDFRGHHAARGVLTELQELLHLFRLAVVHFIQHFLTGFGRKAGNQVGCGVRAHFLDDVSCFL